ncbi:MAG: hypothetical protein OXR66_01700 [Candidatus Woesearchaeota archaeon]|nr:hypothetical protein [Candidatus Woesearchaeota archaeon]
MRPVAPLLTACLLIPSTTVASDCKARLQPIANIAATIAGDMPEKMEDALGGIAEGMFMAAMGRGRHKAVCTPHEVITYFSPFIAGIIDEGTPAGYKKGYRLAAQLAEFAAETQRRSGVPHTEWMQQALGQILTSYTNAEERARSAGKMELAAHLQESQRHFEFYLE